MAEKHVHKVYGSFPPWGKSVEFPAGGGGGNYVYYSGEGGVFFPAGISSSILKLNIDGEIIFMTTGEAIMGKMFPGKNIMGAGFDLSMKVTNSSGELVPVGDFIAEHSKYWTQITEEEFYDPNWGAGNGDDPM